MGHTEGILSTELGSRTGGGSPCHHGFLGFYDGSSGAEQNYEERTGVALSFDLERWRRLTPDQPRVASAQGTGSVRYLDAVPVGDEWWLYYEMSRVDAAHELRMSKVPAP